MPGEPGANTPAATALEAAPVLVAGACDTPQHHQFDFSLGDWQVFDATDKLVAFDRVEKRYDGCVVEQNMTFVTDLYRRPGASQRLSGMAPIATTARHGWSCGPTINGVRSRCADHRIRAAPWCSKPLFPRGIAT